MLKYFRYRPETAE